MSQTKTERDHQSQLGQFFTPSKIATEMVANLPLTKKSVVLEPSAGDGAFLIPLIKKLMKFYTGNQQERLSHVLKNNIYAIEIDRIAYKASLARIKKVFGVLPKQHNIICSDFFTANFADRKFNFIVGNPPFGGTINPTIQDELDKKFGNRDGLKIKKETYSFFIVACTEMLSDNGQLKFICSDTFMTISTMMGLREFLLNRGDVEVNALEKFSDETQWPMTIIDFARTGKSNFATINGKKLYRKTIDLTGNKSWKIDNEFARFFDGPKIGDFMVGTGGMTIGKNELFLRDIVDNKISEPYIFEFFDDPITLEKEKSRARLQTLSEKQISKIVGMEKNNQSKRNVNISKRSKNIDIDLPHSDYLFYNKSSSDIVYAQPKSAIYWKNDGDAVLTFKKNGNWYLHGVGGAPFFKKEGLSWQLISKTLNTRYLPAGYILDSGAPSAFLREDIDKNELWFILGWTLTPLCTRILKEVINHTKNIQSKDFEKLPYPYWVDKDQKLIAIKMIKQMVKDAINGKSFDHNDIIIHELSRKYE